jgi:histidinol-phosphatase
MDMRTELAFALELAECAAPKILSQFHNCTVSYKSDGTEVTEADRAAESIMRELIAQRFPDDDVLGEEWGRSGNGLSARMWILDPIDGTAWFTMGIPVFGTLVALCEYDEPVLGVIHFPAMGETVYASKGQGCWFRRGKGNPSLVRVAATVPLKSATVCASGPHASNIQSFPNSRPYNLTGIIAQARKFKFGPDCLQHALVARGRINAAIDTVMKSWDIAALVPCIEEAGGIVTDFQGNRLGILNSDNLLASCSGQLHDDMLEVLNAGADCYDTLSSCTHCNLGYTKRADT